ncbi:unnamed protein product [Cylicocyclus nassatus]|uniref:2Fe-2S ferredoxin-type domain-containing protein n=1 Tax=Cylicocyclus nassatus TaxID=53992 RepID=A0AA36H6F1_CYLNA|nr:unnamed protein product [Cylicocyclus nassatus]
MINDFRMASRSLVPLYGGRHLLGIVSAAPFISTCPLSTRLPPTKTVEFYYGSRKYVGTGKLGDTLLHVVKENGMPFVNFGACGGTMACSTCHVILTPEHFERVDRINPASQEEHDLLDEAPELTNHSRLACRIELDRKDPETIGVHVPLERRDARVKK